MLMVQAIAHYTMAEADNVRKGIGKKIEEIIIKHGKIFAEKGSDRYPKERLARYWNDVIVPFAKYAFNKSHAASYARIGSVQAWLKLNWPAEFMAASLKSLYASNKTPDAKSMIQDRYFSYCAKKGINITPPSINQSEISFTATEDGDIVFGLSEVKDVGSASKHIILERDINGEYMGPADFFNRVSGIRGVTRKAVERVIQSGALDEFGYSRSSLLSVFDDFSDVISKNKTNKSTRELLDDSAIPKIDEFKKSTILKGEKFVTGIYISGHPLESLMGEIRVKNSVLFRDIEVKVSEDDDPDGTIEADNADRVLARLNGTRYSGIAMISSVDQKLTKATKQPFAFVELDDGTGVTKAAVFSRRFPDFKDVLVPGNIAKISGKFLVDDKGSTISIEGIGIVTPPDDMKIHVFKASVKDLPKIERDIRCYPGELITAIATGTTITPLPRKYWISQLGLSRLIEKYEIRKVDNKL